MRLVTGMLAAAAALSVGTAQAATLEVKDAVMRLTVIPEDRSDIKVEVVATNPRLPLKVEQRGDRTTVSGGLGRQIRQCLGSAHQARVTVKDVGEVAWRDMPQIIVRTPRAVSIDAGGAIYGAVGRSASLDLGNAGCGDWVVANVEGPMHISQAGQGDTRTGQAGQARLRVAGTGDITTAAVHGALKVEIAGAGDVSVASVAGPVDVRIAGSGDVQLGSGHAPAMTVSLAGSGDVDFQGIVNVLKVRIAGSGDIRVKEVRGTVSKAIMGSGTVVIGEGSAPRRP